MKIIKLAKDKQVQHINEPIIKEEYHLIAAPDETPDYKSVSIYASEDIDIYFCDLVTQGNQIITRAITREILYEKFLWSGSYILDVENSAYDFKFSELSKGVKFYHGEKMVILYALEGPVVSRFSIHERKLIETAESLILIYEMQNQIQDKAGEVRHYNK